jgi:hypothetical protein
MKELLLINETPPNNRNVKVENKIPEIQTNIYNDKDAYGNANFFSKLIFYWSCRLIRLANKTTLKRDYLGKLETNQKSENYMDTAYNIWDNFGYKKLPSLRLLKTTLRTNICNL